MSNTEEELSSKDSSLKNQSILPIATMLDSINSKLENMQTTLQYHSIALETLGERVTKLEVKSPLEMPTKQSTVKETHGAPATQSGDISLSSINDNQSPLPLPIQLPMPQHTRLSEPRGEVGIIVGNEERFTQELSSLHDLYECTEHNRLWDDFKTSNPGSRQTFFSTMGPQVRATLKLYTNSSFASITDDHLREIIKNQWLMMAVQPEDVLAALTKVKLDTIFNPRDTSFDYSFHNTQASIIKYLRDVDYCYNHMKDLTRAECDSNRSNRDLEEETGKPSTIWGIVKKKIANHGQGWLKLLLNGIIPKDYAKWPELSAALQIEIQKHVREYRRNISTHKAINGMIASHKHGQREQSRQAITQALKQSEIDSRIKEKHKLDRTKFLMQKANNPVNVAAMEAIEPDMDAASDKDEDGVESSSEDEAITVPIMQESALVAAITSDKDKKEHMCYRYMQGTCEKGDDCSYSHSREKFRDAMNHMLKVQKAHDL